MKPPLLADIGYIGILTLSRLSSVTQLITMNNVGLAVPYVLDLR